MSAHYREFAYLSPSPLVSVPGRLYKSQEDKLSYHSHNVRRIAICPSCSLCVSTVHESTCSHRGCLSFHFLCKVKLRITSLLWHYVRLDLQNPRQHSNSTDWQCRLVLLRLCPDVRPTSSILHPAQALCTDHSVCCITHTRIYHNCVNASHGIYIFM